MGCSRCIADQAWISFGRNMFAGGWNISPLWDNNLFVQSLGVSTASFTTHGLCLAAPLILTTILSCAQFMAIRWWSQPSSSCYPSVLLPSIFLWHRVLFRHQLFQQCSSARAKLQHLSLREYFSWFLGIELVLIATLSRTIIQSSIPKPEPVNRIRLCDPHGLWPARLLPPWDSSWLEWVAISLHERSCGPVNALPICRAPLQVIITVSSRKPG